MQIIPVIDLMGGIVVHARQGQRQSYQPIKSDLCLSAEPKAFIKALLELHPFKCLYLADLDAIMSGNMDLACYTELVESFPEIEFWLDAGVKTVQQYQKLKAIDGMRIIVASESMEEIDLLSQVSVLSLDYKDGELLSKVDLMAHIASWPEQIIVLSLDQVGSHKGPNIALLEKIKTLAGDGCSFIVGGGARDEQDLALLEARNVRAVLIASALHNGKINKQVLLNYL